MSKKNEIPQNVSVKIKPDNFVHTMDDKRCKVSLREFYNLDVEVGKQVTMSEKDRKYVSDSFKRFVKAQSILESYYKN